MIGGCSTLLNSLIDKFNKNGHKVYLITGQRKENTSYRHVFEKYNFPYDSSALMSILESVRPDVTVFTGAFDTNFNWDEGALEAVRYNAGLVNILSSFDTLHNKGKFFYLSSEEIFCKSYKNDVTEEVEIFPNGYKAKAVAQGEVLCENYRSIDGLNTFVLRFDKLYWLPEKGVPQNNPVYRMVIEAIRTGKIGVNPGSSFSMIFLNDAVEQAYRIMCAQTLNYNCYNITSSEEISEKQLAEKIKGEIGSEIEIVENSLGSNNRLVFSNKRYDSEFKVDIFNDSNIGVKKTVNHVKRHKADFVKDISGASNKKTIEKIREAFKILAAYLENIACFLLVFWINSLTKDLNFFERLDIYLLYVLLFAVMHGQVQAIFSCVLSVVGFIIGGMYSRTGFEILTDFNTYVWMAQLFIAGLTVGYLKDRLHNIKSEADTRAKYLQGQLKDIQEINDSNMRIKQNYEAQVINNKDSLGRIYNISASLEQYEPAEVLFYAAQAISNLMDCKDVAIYAVANSDYARLFSATSNEARKLGNSINYSAMKEMYEKLSERRVYINRDLTDNMPSMVAPVYSEDKMELILMLWDLPWERMTLAEANRLTIVGAMIQNAIVRANRYMEALRTSRYIEGTNILDMDAFVELVTAFSGARSKGLTDFTLIEIATNGQPYDQVINTIGKNIRNSDSAGILEDGHLYVLLSNTNAESAGIIIERFKNSGYDSWIKER